MKKKKVLLLTALITYCYLFYEQSAGINFLLFDIVLLLSMLVIDRSLIKSSSWVVVSLGALVSACGIVLYGNALSVFGNVFSLLLLTHLGMKQGCSLVFAFLQVGYSYITMSYAAVEKRFFSSETSGEAKAPEGMLGNMLRIAVPVVIGLVFLVVYRLASPVFNEFINNLSFDFLSWKFIWFTIVGFVLLAGYFYPRSWQALLQTDKQAADVLPGQLNEKEFSIFNDAGKEYSAGTLLFCLLNGLLLLVNLLDINFILRGGKLPDGMNHSEYVHQGVNSSIFSMLMAILVTLYFFRGNLNFIAKNKLIKALALIWIFQNAALAGTCIYKNWIYIYDCGLTYKRIEVYVYLLLVFVGLCTTWIKITALKSNWYLLRRNTWAIYVVLIVSTLFHWDRIIISYNATHASGVERSYYLYTMSETALPLLLADFERGEEEVYYSGYYRRTLQDKTDEFLKAHRENGWQSWNLEDERTYRLIKQIKKH